MADISSLFVHCSGYRHTSEMVTGSITPPDFNVSLCDGCSKEPYVVNYICGDGKRMVESEKNNVLCDECFVKMDYCSNDCDYSPDYYMSDDYYEMKKEKIDYDYSNRFFYNAIKTPVVTLPPQLQSSATSIKEETKK